MRRFILSMAAALTGIWAFAGETQGYYVREYRNEDYPLSFEARLGIGGSPEVASEFFHSGSYRYDVYDVWFPNNPLSRMYKDYSGPLYSTGAICGEFVMHFKPRTAFVAIGGLCSVWNDTFNGVTDAKTGRKTGVVLYLAPGLRGYWVKRDIIRLYSSFYVGISKYLGFDELKYSYRSDDGIRYVDESFKFLGQITPIGIEVGRKLYGFLEFGAGSVYCGASAGIGYKF